MRVVLINPPFCEPSSPPLGLAYLASALRAKKYAYHIVDLNLDFWDTIESEDWRKECHTKIIQQMDGMNRNVEHLAQQLRKYLALADQSIWTRSPSVSRADFEPTVEAKYEYFIRCRMATLALTSTTYPDVQLDFRNLVVGPSRHDLDQLSSQAVKTSGIFYTWLTHWSKSLQSIIKFAPDWIGISVSYDEQLLPSLSIANYLKKHLQTTIIGGGSLFHAFAKHIGIRTPFWNLLDGIVIGPGEQAIGLLTQQPDKRIIPSVAHKQFPNGSWLLDITHWPPKPPPYPDFSAFPLPKYRAPGIVLPYRVFSKCSWGRCTFCADTKYGFHVSTHHGNPILVAEDILALSEKYGAKGFYLLDSELPTQFLYNLALSLSQKSKKIRWGGNARFSKELSDPKMGQLLFASGCRLLRFGLESASKKILKSICKGISLKVASQVLRSLSQAGIVTHVYLMKGIPGETSTDWQPTRQFLLEHASYIDMFNISFFNLYEESPLWHVLQSEHKLIETASEEKWCYPEIQDAVFVDRHHEAQSSEKLLHEFFAAKGYTKNCVTTPDTLLLADQMTTGLFRGQASPRRVTFCEQCVVIAVKNHLFTIPFAPAKVASSLTDLNTLKKEADLIYCPTCLITDAFGHYWQVPYRWKRLLVETPVTEAIKLMSGKPTLTWAIDRGILHLIHCSGPHDQHYPVNESEPSVVEPVIIPVGEHFDGYFEAPEA